MRETNSDDAREFANSEVLERFRKVQRLTNHWSRPIGRRAYYWYLTFENSPELHSLVRKCQEAIAFPYYDPTSPDGLHLTLDRISFDGDITLDQLGAIEAAATRACQDIPPLDITIGSLGGTPGAIGFTASPDLQIRNLRDVFRAATLSVYPKAPIKCAEFHAHVAIAYSNSDDVAAAEVIATAEKLNSMPHVDVVIREGALVLLERRECSYAWQVIARIPLSG